MKPGEHDVDLGALITLSNVKVFGSSSLRQWYDPKTKRYYEQRTTTTMSADGKPKTRVHRKRWLQHTPFAFRLIERAS